MAEPIMYGHATIGRYGGTFRGEFNAMSFFNSGGMLVRRADAKSINC
jgi:hypothetical protein